MQSEDNQWMDPLLWELANDLGGGCPASGANGSVQQPIASPPDVQSNISQPLVVNGRYQNVDLTATADLLQQPVPGIQIGLANAASLPANFGSPHDHLGMMGVHGLDNLACYGSLGSGGMLQPPAMLYKQNSYTAAAMTAAATAARPAGSHSPSSSSGGQVGEEYADQSEQYRPKKALNKGALAQKRFRERQKEKMRANEAQLADLTARLEALELEKCRLESRARLLEQVVSLNLTHEARLHTNKEIMVREQEMLLEELAEFVIMLGLNPVSSPSTAAGGPDSPVLSPDGLQATSQQQQQQQQQQVVASGVAAVVQSMRSWSVANMTEHVFPQYIHRLQQLLHLARSSSSSSGDLAGSSAAAAAAAQQEVSRLVLCRREMTDRHALFSHYYWAVWCLNKSEMQQHRHQEPPPDTWRVILHQLQLTADQQQAVITARRSLLAELQRVADEWQKVLPTLALQLLQVPRDQWHTVGAVQSMVCNLAAEREAVVAFLHNIVNEVLTPQQEGQLEASSYPWCPDVWAIAAAAAAAAEGGHACHSGDSAGSSSGNRGGKGRRDSKGGPASGCFDPCADDPLAALTMGTDVLQPLMPFMTAFQLLRAPITARGAGLRLKRALLLDPFKCVVPAAAFSQPSAAEVSSMSLLDAHCGSFQQMMLWDWLKANLPGYLTLPGLNPTDMAAAAARSPAAASGGAAAAAAGGGSGGLGGLAGVGGLVGPVGVC